MGIFDFVTELTGNTEKKIELYGRRVRHKDTPVEQRESAALWLAEEGSQPALVAMMGRFEMTYEHLMKDQVEKERVERLLLGSGTDAIPALEEFLRRGRNFPRALKVYEELAGSTKAKAMVLELVEVEFNKSGLKPKKKGDLLVTLSRFKGTDVTESAVRFLDDFDEGCRYAAAEVLANQEETPEIRDALIGRLVPDEESGRVKHKVAELAVARGWTVGEVDLPDGYSVVNGVVKAG